MKWKSSTFGDAFDIQLGKMLDRKKNIGDLSPYLANRNVQWGKCRTSDLAEMRFTESDRKKFSLKTGDLLVCEGGEVGRTAIWEGKVKNCFYQKAIHRLRPKSAIEPRFVLHYMKLAANQNIFAKLTTATSIAHLTKAKLQKVPLPLPPLAEQRRIAGILDAADALRAKRKQALAHLDDLLQSTFLTLFGDPVTNPMGWDNRLFGDVVSSRLGKMLDKGKQSGKHLFPYLANLNVQWGKFILDDLREMDFSENDRSQFKLIEGDLLVCEGGEIGRCAIWKHSTKEIYFQKALHRCRVNSELLTSEYVQFYLWFMANKGGFKDFVTSATIAHLTGAKLKKLPIPLPPLPLQQRFAAIVEQIEAQKARHRAHLAELDTLFASLQSRAFQGEL